MWCMRDGCRSEVEECPDQDTSKMQAKLSIVPIDQLSLFIGKKVSQLNSMHAGLPAIVP